MNQTKEFYLGDGLYVSDDGYQITFRAPRHYGDHVVALESDVLENFFLWLEKARNLKITVQSVVK